MSFKSPRGHKKKSPSLREDFDDFSRDELKDYPLPRSENEDDPDREETDYTETTYYLI